MSGSIYRVGIYVQGPDSDGIWFPCGDEEIAEVFREGIGRLLGAVRPDNTVSFDDVILRRAGLDRSRNLLVKNLQGERGEFADSPAGND